MKSVRTYVIFLLAVTTGAGAFLAWSQYGELVELRAAAMNRDERADLQKRLWDLEKNNRALQERVASQRDPAVDVESVLAGASETSDNDRRDRSGGRGGRGDSRDRMGDGLQQATAIRELMNKPEVQAMINLQQKAAIEQRYATLFKNLNLQPDQIDKLKNLLAERSTTMQDVMGAARDQGVNPRDNPEAFRKMMADAQNVINHGIKATIGDAGFAQLTTYEQTLPQRNVVNELQQRLSFTSTPLTSAQAEQLVGILATNTPPRVERPRSAPGSQPTLLPGPSSPPGGGRGPDVGGLIAGAIGGAGVGMMMGSNDGPGRGTAPVTSAAVTQAHTVLAPPQVAALQGIQQQQQAQQQLRQLVNDTLSANQPTSSKAKGTTLGTTGTNVSPSRKR